MNYDLFRPHINMYFTVLSLRYHVLWREDTVQVTFFCSTQTFFFFGTIEKVRHYFLFVFQTTWQTSWNGIILFCDGLNIGAHLPFAVKEALAAAAAFSRTIWIKPKSRGALPVCLAFPTVITAKRKKKNTALHKMINTATQIVGPLQAFVVGSFMAYFKTITRDMIVRQVGSNRISDGWIKVIQNSFSDSLLIEF